MHSTRATQRCGNDTSICTKQTAIQFVKDIQFFFYACSFEATYSCLLNCGYSYTSSKTILLIYFLNILITITQAYIMTQLKMLWSAKKNSGIFPHKCNTSSYFPGIKIISSLQVNSPSRPNYLPVTNEPHADGREEVRQLIIIHAIYNAEVVATEYLPGGTRASDTRAASVPFSYHLGHTQLTRDILARRFPSEYLVSSFLKLRYHSKGENKTKLLTHYQGITIERYLKD